MTTTIFSLSQFSAFFMCGVLWIVQLILYPAFASIDPKQFEQFHFRHTNLMGVLVGPVMVIELFSSLFLMWEHRNLISALNLAIVIALWALTFFVSVPLHNKLVSGFDLETINKLVLTNWPRTILWTLRVVLVSLWHPGLRS